LQTKLNSKSFELGFDDKEDELGWIWILNTKKFGF
jgi:hypothetical protein